MPKLLLAVEIPCNFACDSKIGGAESMAMKFHFNVRGEVCDPMCLLQGPATSKVPKVDRTGCKRSLGPREQRSPKSLLHHLNPVLHRCNFFSCTSARGLCSLGPKGLLPPLLTTLGTFEVSGPCSRHSGSQGKVWVNFLALLNCSEVSLGVLV